MSRLCSLILLLACAPAFAEDCPEPDDREDGSMCLAWSVPTTATDGSPLTSLTGFELFFHTQPITPDNVADAKKYEIPEADQDSFVTEAFELESPGSAGGDVPVYARILAVTAEGLRSALSNEINYSVNFPNTQEPNPPQIREMYFRIKIVPSA